MGNRMSSLVIYGDTSGAITLTPTAIAGTNTQTLPAATGTVMVSGNMPAFSAYLSTNQSFSATTWTKVQFNTEVFDTASAYDNATNYRFTPQVAGYYQMNCASAINGSPSSMYIGFYKNGSLNVRTYFGSSVASLSSLFYLNGSTDYLEVYVYVYGSPTTINGSASDTFFQGALVRTA